ncbi:hypothetical protein MNBD_GAMMA01-1341 [hydrothermal vent metagenome]|uniref:Uncharacterized protein n=1 Tax=hydrothermal vent metagenome TaxID=652676 RepID=A0A3B0V5W3_9ZZZZ
MAELVIKIGSVSANPAHYQDGDILEAFNRRRIRQSYAEQICSITHVNFNSDGLNPLNCLTAKMYDQTALYRYVRVSRTEVIRTNLDTGEKEAFSAKPNIRGEAIDLPLYLAERIKHPNHLIFGTKENEVWYGHNLRRTSHAALDKVWNAIETETEEREIFYQLWPLSKRERQAYLAISVQDFTDNQAALFVRPELKLIGVNDRGDDVFDVTRKRSQLINWKNLSLPVSEAILENKTVDVDIRNSLQFDYSKIVKTKDKITGVA